MTPRVLEGLTTVRDGRQLGVVVPAAGKGLRMRARFPHTPKVLVEVCGRTMIERVVSALNDLTAIERMVIVVNAEERERIVEHVGEERAEFVVQARQQGTGDAVHAAKDLLQGEITDVLVVFGDQPFISTRSLLSLVERHKEDGGATTMFTVHLEDFEEWRRAFWDWGRVVRGDGGEFERIVEAKDCSPGQLRLQEVNPSIYCFEGEFLWEALSEISPNNAQNEYLLTDVVEVATSWKRKVVAVAMDDPREALGINSPEQLDTVHGIFTGGCN